MRKLTTKEFAEWLGYDPETVSGAIQLVQISDPDGAYTTAEDMGEYDMAEVIEAIYFEHGSLKDAIKACKEDLGLLGESVKPKTQKIKLSEVRQLVKKMLKEESEDDLIEFTVPDWAMSALINGDYSGLSDEDEVKIDEFVNDTVQEFGNANFMDGDEDLGFCRSNDIDSLGSNCYKLLLKPSKMQESIKPKTQKIKLSEIRQLVRKSLNEAWKTKAEVKKTGEHADKTVAQLRKELKALKDKSKKYQDENKKVPKSIIDQEKEINFAIRAKQGWKKGKGATK